MKTYISELHANLRAGRLINRGAGFIPGDAERRQYKQYVRMHKIKLADEPIDSLSLADSLKRRSSFDTRLSNPFISLKDISLLLGAGLRIRNDSTRPYPSGGALYPIETYFVGATDGYDSDVFHYQPKTHELEHLWRAEPDRSIFITPSDLKTYPSALIFTAVWNRSMKKYGDFSYNLALLEAGHMAQNILLVAAGANILTRPMCGFNDSKLQKLLNLGDDEQALYSIILSKP